MSLMKFFQIINSSGFGRFIDGRLDVLKKTDPDRIYVENIRSFYKMPYFVAKFFCEMAVRNNLFIKKIGVLCPNEGRIILIVDRVEDIPDVIHCDNCELLEEEKYEFNRKECQTIVFYKLNRMEYAG
jgi:hypothetical protein